MITYYWIRLLILLPAKKWIDFILGSPSTQSILLFVYPFNISSWVSKWQTSTSIPLYSMPEFPYLSFNLSGTEFSRFQSTLKNPYLHDDMHWLHFQLHLIHVIFFFTNWIHGRRLSLIWTASSNLDNMSLYSDWVRWLWLMDFLHCTPRVLKHLFLVLLWSGLSQWGNSSTISHAFSMYSINAVQDSKDSSCFPWSMHDLVKLSKWVLTRL